MLLPPEQAQPAITAHEVVQPSVLSLLPSSQYPEAGLTFFPSPQISEQTLGDVGDPGVHCHKGSTEQEESHPSVFTEFPSSQYPAVGVMTFPSPQISVHVSGAIELPPEQTQPVDTEQEFVQPSVLSLLPSSQYPEVGLTFLPSPQISVQMLAVVDDPGVHCHKGRTEQDESHPSVFTELPSLQYPAVGFITFPSPQSSIQESAVVALPPEHTQPASTAQLELQPSPPLESPSSQYPEVGLTFFPSPQISEQTLGVFSSPAVHCQ
jgi:hypothetical protein